MKVAINKCHGGFGLSNEAVDRYIELAGLKLYKEFNEQWGWFSYYTVPPKDYHDIHKYDMVKTRWKGKDEGAGRYQVSNSLCWSPRDIPRNDLFLIQVIEEMGVKAESEYASISIVNIPNDVDFSIEEYDGKEWIAEVHRTWE